MKKIFGTLLILAVMLTSTVAMAASRETTYEGADLSTIKRLAVALPMYYRVETAEPTFEEFTNIIFDASKVAHGYVISYDEIAANIKRDTGVDIKSLSNEEALKTYNDNIAKYADAFIVVTVINSHQAVQFFFDVKDAQSKNFVYGLRYGTRSIGKNSNDYKKACETFYKKFDKAIDKSIKKAQKNNKD